ncbi:MAG: AEC family transporter [Thermoproteota archaeon]
MQSLLETVFEIAAFITLGSILRRIHVLNEFRGGRLLSISLNLLLPIIVFKSFATVRMAPKDALLPVLGITVNLLLLTIAHVVSGSLFMNDAKKGAFLLACSTLNIGIVGLPFIESFFGAKGVATASLLDIGNSLYVFSIAFLVASRFNPSKRGKSIERNLKRFLTQPYIISIIFGITINLLKIELPQIIETFSSTVSLINTFLILTTIGAFIKLPSGRLVKEIVASTLVKFPLGGLIGWVLASLLGLVPQAVRVTVMVSSLPPAFMTLIHAQSENLDLEFATILLSYMLAIGIVTIIFYGLLFLV